MNDTTATHKGGPACTVCNHPRRDELDRALARGLMTAAEVAREVGCHRSSVGRHVKNHLLPALAEKVAADPELQGIDIIGELKALYARMRRHLDRAEQADNWRAIRSFHSEARQDLELLARLLGELQEQQTTVNVLVTSPEWVTTRAALMRALEPYPDARAAVAVALRGDNHAGA